MNKFLVKNIRVYVTLIFFFAAPMLGFAADISVEASKTSVSVGDIVTATVYVKSPSEAINNVDGLVTISSNALEIQSVSNSGSVLSLWVEQPTYSGQSVTFNGGIPNPGFTGEKGKVVTIFLRAVREGTATIGFQSASVRANDGLGTDVTKSKIASSVTVGSVPVIPVVPSAPASAPLPAVRSADTPNTDSWYDTKSTTLSWSVPAGVTAVRTILSESADTSPSVLYQPPITSRTVSGLSEGTSYFRIQFQNESGWGRIATYPINIDTIDPSDIAITTETAETGDITLSLAGTDEGSGVDRFVVALDGREDIEISSVTDNAATVVVPYIASGEFTGTVTAYDKAGNSFTKPITLSFAEPQLPEPTVSVENEPWYVSVIPYALIVILSSTLLVLLLKKQRSIRSERSQRKRALRRLERDTMQIIRDMKSNIVQDIHLCKHDKSITSVKDAEKMLLNNMLIELKNAETLISRKIKKLKVVRDTDDEDNGSY